MSTDTDEQILKRLSKATGENYGLDEEQSKAIKNPEIVKGLIQNILVAYGSTVVLSRRKATVNTTNFIMESKNVMAHLPAYLRVAASLIRVTFKFASFILKKYGSKSSISFQVKGFPQKTVISYKEFVAYHEYVLKARVLKIAKYNTFARKRLIKGVAASFNPVVPSTSLTAAMGKIRLPKNLAKSHGKLLEYCQGEIVSRGLVNELIRACYGPGDSTGAASYGTYIRYESGDFLDGLIRSVLPFSKEKVDLTDDKGEYNDKAREIAEESKFFQHALESGKRKVGVKALFKTSNTRIRGNGRDTFLSLCTGGNKIGTTGDIISNKDGMRNVSGVFYLASSALTSLISCHTLTLNDASNFGIVEGFGVNKAFITGNLTDAVNAYKGSNSSINVLRDVNMQNARREAFEVQYARVIANNANAATSKKRGSVKNQDKYAF